MNDVILSAYHGGLGDNLQFSTLPEEFYKQHGRKTYIKDGTNFRNKEIYDLVWGHNPYICGVKEGNRNAGDISEIIVKNHTNNWISNWEYLHGLEPKNKYPKIYYTPNKINGFEETILVDLSSISLKFDGIDNGYDVQKVLNSYLELKKKHPNKKFLRVKFKNDFADINQIDLSFDDHIIIDSIFHYCDLMYSSSGVCGLHSGSISLAASIKRFNNDLDIFCIVSSNLYDKMIGWVNNKELLGSFYLDYVNYVVS